MPNVKEDIQEIQKLIVQERFKISKKCTDSIAQIQTYAWDPKAQARGEDKPLKINDHCPDMWRAAIMGTRYFSTGGYTRSRHKNLFKIYFVILSFNEVQGLCSMAISKNGTILPGLDCLKEFV